MWVTHDYFDRIWDEFDPATRRNVAAAIRAILLDTDMLRDWAHVDVLSGQIKVAYTEPQALVRWEAVPA